MKFIGKEIIIRYESGLEVTAFVTFDTDKGRQSFFDKGVIEEVVES